MILYEISVSISLFIHEFAEFLEIKSLFLLDEAKRVIFLSVDEELCLALEEEDRFRDEDSDGAGLLLRWL